MYELNEKLQALRAYVPVEAEGCVRLDANESFLSLPTSTATRTHRRLSSAGHLQSIIRWILGMW